MGGEGSDVEAQIERYMWACVALRGLSLAGRINLDPKQQQQNQNRQRSASMSIECTCDHHHHAPLHASKRPYTLQFPELILPRHVGWDQQKQRGKCDAAAAEEVEKTRRCRGGPMGRRLGRRRRRAIQSLTPYYQDVARATPMRLATNGGAKSVNIRAARINVQDLVPEAALVQTFATLPDIGIFLRTVLQKRFTSPALEKHNAKCSAALDGSPRRVGSNVGGGGTPGREGGAGQQQEQDMSGYANHACAIIIQDSILCIKRCKKVGSASQKQGEGGGWLPASTTGVELDVCIHIMHGTLLKLYPLGTKRPRFTARVRVACRLRDLLLSSTDEKLAFLCNHVSLVKLCMIEHTVNMLAEFLPCERKILAPMMPGTAPFEPIVVSTCDAFRQEAVLTGDESWEHMDALAAPRVEKCTRVCKLKMARVPEPVTKMCISADSFQGSSLDMLHTRGDPMVATKLHPWLTQAQAEFACKLHGAVSCHALPVQVARMQQAAAERIHGSCYRRLYCAQNLAVCLLCAVNGRPIGGKLRMDSFTGDLTCDSCPPGTVVTINMVGVFLKVCSTSYYTCPGCTRMRVWWGDGHDIPPSPDGSSVCGCAGESLATHHHHHHRQQQQMQQIVPPRCMVCNAKNTGRPFMTLPDLRGRAIVRCYLCTRHSLPHHIVKHITNTMDLERALADQQKRSVVGVRR